jgi:phosphoribosylformylglycinamidine (FGAM) synthase-like enzyme
MFPARVSIRWGVLLPGGSGVVHIEETASKSLAALEAEKNPEWVQDAFLNGARVVVVEVTERIVSQY